MAANGSAGGVLDEIVVGPVVGVSVGEEDSGNFQIAKGREQFAAAGGHVDDERLAGVAVGDEVSVVAVGAEGVELCDGEGAVGVLGGHRQLVIGNWRAVIGITLH